MKRNRSRPSSTNSRGVQANTSTSCRPPMSGTATSPLRGRGGAHSDTEGKGTGSTPSFLHRLGVLGCEVAVGLVQPEQVLALDVEHQHPQVAPGIPDDVGASGQHPQPEQGEGRLGGDTADAADRHVAALAPVEEVEIDEHRETVAAQPHRQRPLHLIGVQGLATLLPRRPGDIAAGIGGHPHLGVHPGDRDACRTHLAARHAPLRGDPDRVGLEGGPLVDGLDLGDDAVGVDLPATGHLGAHHHQIVELQVLVLGEDDPELPGGCVLAADHMADTHAASIRWTAARR